MSADIRFKVAPVGTHMRIAEVLCHEIAHQWFGDLVTADVWGDVFLHESFARFFNSYLFMDFKAPGQRQFAVSDSDVFLSTTFY